MSKCKKVMLKHHQIEYLLSILPPSASKGVGLKVKGKLAAAKAQKAPQ